MSLTIPPWIEPLKQRAAVAPQLMAVIEAYHMAPDDACPAVNPLLTCADCRTKVMLRPHPLRVALSLGWWEVANVVHAPRGHRLETCHAEFIPHSERRCKAEQERLGLDQPRWLWRDDEDDQT